MSICTRAVTHTSMNIEPNGKIPPSRAMAHGSMNHFFSGMGLGTVLIRQGRSDSPDILRPRIVPTKLRGRIMNRHIHTTVNCKEGAGIMTCHS